MSILSKYSIPMSVIVTVVPMLVIGASAWFDLKHAAAMNAKTNEQQQEQIDAIEDAANKADQDRARIQANQSNILRALERLERKLDRQ